MPYSEIGPMTSQVNVLYVPYHNTGGHFINWSMQYVCGLVDAPTTTPSPFKNWHHHKANYVAGHQAVIDCVKELRKSTRPFENINARYLHLHTTMQEMFGVDVQSSTVEQINQVRQSIIDDARNLLLWVQAQGMIPVIFDYHLPDYFSIFYNNRYLLGINNEKFDKVEQLHEQYLDYFFKKSTKHFQQNIWDKREMYALMYSFDDRVQNLKDLCDQSLPHLYYNTDDVWNNLPPVLEEICLVLNLPLMSERLARWKEVYQDWREVHDPYFGRHLDQIIDAIVKGTYMSLRRFQMNFYHEVIIQNQLIVRHGLNLKNWQLTKFPDNTLDLHQLLEPNIHVN